MSVLSLSPSRIQRRPTLNFSFNGNRPSSFCHRGCPLKLLRPRHLIIQNWLRLWVANHPLANLTSSSLQFYFCLPTKISVEAALAICPSRFQLSSRFIIYIADFTSRWEAMPRLPSSYYTCARRNYGFHLEEGKTFNSTIRHKLSSQRPSSCPSSSRCPSHQKPSRLGRISSRRPHCSSLLQRILDGGAEELEFNETFKLGGWRAPFSK